MRRTSFPRGAPGQRRVDFHWEKSCAPPLLSPGSVEEIVFVVLQNKLLLIEIPQGLDHLASEHQGPAVHGVREEDLVVHREGQTMGLLGLRSHLSRARIRRGKGMTAAARDSNEIREDLKRKGKQDIVVGGLDLHIGLKLNDVGSACVHKPKVVTGGLKDSLCERHDRELAEFSGGVLDCAEKFRPTLVRTPIQNEKEVVKAMRVDKDLQQNIVQNASLVVNRHHNAKGWEVRAIHAVHDDLGLLRPRAI